jgi:hypothetical protein
MENTKTYAVLDDKYFLGSFLAEGAYGDVYIATGIEIDH